MVAAKVGCLYLHHENNAGANCDPATDCERLYRDEPCFLRCPRCKKYYGNQINGAVVVVVENKVRFLHRHA